MPRYEIVEIEKVRAVYEVEADSKEEAEALHMAGQSDHIVDSDRWLYENVSFEEIEE